MSRGIFGWSLPPGVSMRDIDPDPGPCQVCGRDPSGDCLCPECPTCGVFGDPECYEKHGLVRTPEQIESRKLYDEQRAHDAQVEPDFAPDVPDDAGVEYP